MSLAMVNAVRGFQTNPTAKSVLVAMADYSNDDGHCWPSIARLCEFTCLSERAVRNAVRELERSGVLVSDRASGRTNSYRIRAEKARSQAETPAPDAGVMTPNPSTTCPPAEDATPAPRAGTPAGDAGVPRHHVPVPRHHVPPNHQEQPIEPPRTTKPRAARSSDDAVQLPEWMPSAEWAAYLDYRKRKDGKPMTGYAQKLAVGKLEQLRAAGDAPADVLNASILSNWSGLFPLKKSATRKPSGLVVGQQNYAEEWK